MNTTITTTKRTLLLIALLAFLALGFSAITPQESMAGSISGRITDKATGAPVTDVYIFVYDMQWENVAYTFSYYIGADGTYTIGGLPTGSYYVQAYSIIPGSWGDPGDYMIQYYNSKDNWNMAVPVTVTDPQDTPNINFKLVLGGSITGTVTDSQGQPTGLYGYDLMVDALDTNLTFLRFGLTKQDGTYRIGGLKSGNYKVRTDSNYFEWTTDSAVIDEYYNNTYNWQQATGVRVTMGQNTPNINFNLSSNGATIRGTVRDFNGNPIPGMYSSVGATNVATGQGKGSRVDNAGNYTILGLAPGTYKVSAYIYYNQTYYPQDYLLPVTVTSTSNISGIDITLGSGTSNAGITGTVTGTDCSYTYIYTYDTSWNVAAYPIAIYCNNTYTVGQYLPTGSYYVKASPAGWYNESAIPTFYGNTDNSALATLVSYTAGVQSPGIDINMLPGGTISGRTTNALGDPVGGIFLMAYDAADYYRYTYSDADGYYSLRGLISSDYYVKAASNWYGGGYTDEYYNNATTVAAAQLINITGNSAVSNIDFSLDLAGTISGTVTDEQGTPLPYRYVNLYDQQWTLLTNTYADSMGNYTLHTPMAGSYYLYAVDYSNTYANEYYNNAAAKSNASTIYVGAASVVSGINFTLSPIASGGNTITGSILDENGNPANYVYITVYSLNNATGLWEADPAINIHTDHYSNSKYAYYSYTPGTYSISGIPSGTYRIGALRNSWTYHPSIFTRTYSPAATSLSAASNVVVTANGSATANIAFTSPAMGTASISGFITDMDGREHPSVVYCYNIAAFSRNTDTGKLELSALLESGSGSVGPYRLDGLHAGNYILLSYPDYCRWGFWISNGSTTGTNSFVTARTINVAAGANATQDIKLPLRSSVSGTIKDRNGNPVSGIKVRVENSQKNYVDYELIQELMGDWNMPENVTDASGNFRLAMLPNGTYYVYAYDENGVYATTYYSTSPQGTATAINLISGEETTGINITLP